MPKPLKSIEDTPVLTPIQKSLIEGEVAEQIRTVFDPELPVNVYDLGLIYDIIVDNNRDVSVVMTLTSPMCPVAESLPAEVQVAAARTPGVRNVKVEVTWDPPFTIDRIPEEIRLMLGLM